METTTSPTVSVCWGSNPCCSEGLEMSVLHKVQSALVEQSGDVRALLLLQTNQLNSDLYCRPRAEASTRLLALVNRRQMEHKAGRWSVRHFGSRLLNVEKNCIHAGWRLFPRLHSAVEADPAENMSHLDKFTSSLGFSERGAASSMKYSNIHLALS